MGLGGEEGEQRLLSGWVRACVSGRAFREYALEGVFEVCKMVYSRRIRGCVGGG